MELAAIVFLLVIATLILFMLFSVSDGFNIWYQCTFKGYTRIQLYDGQNSFNEAFMTIAKFDKDGELVSPIYRYNATKLGNVRIHKDGTAHYCGSYKWKRA